MEKHYVFIDESGNAGANLLDAQPIFTIAGIAVRESSVEQLSEKLNQLKARHHFKPEHELKGARIIRSRHNVFMKEASGLVLAEGLPVFASVVERKYMIALLTVDNLFDPVYNNRVGNEWTFPIKIKTGLANHFYNHLRDETIALAGRVLTHGDRSDIEKLLSAIEEDLKANRRINRFDIIKALNGCRGFTAELSEVIQATNESDGNPRYTKGTIKAPNVTCFVDTMMRIEHLYEGGSPVQVELVFDSSRQFDQVFSDIFQMHKNAGPARIIIPDHAPLIYGFRFITGFSTRDSLTTPLLQCADYFATGIRSVFGLCLVENQPDEINHAMSFYLAFGHAAGDIGHMVNLVISDYLGRKWFSALKKYAPKK